MKYFISLFLPTHLLLYLYSTRVTEQYNITFYDKPPSVVEDQPLDRPSVDRQLPPFYRIHNTVWNGLLHEPIRVDRTKFGQHLRSQAKSTFFNLKARESDLVFASPESPLGKSVETNLRLSLEKTDIEDTLQYAILRNGDKCRAAEHSSPFKPMTVILISNLEMSVTVEGGKSERSSFKTEQQTLKGCSCFQRVSDVEEVVVTCEGVGKIFPLKHKTFPSLIAPHFESPRFGMSPFEFMRRGFHPRREERPRFADRFFNFAPSGFDSWFAPQPARFLQPYPSIFDD